jgi:hypothetical protein
MDIKKKEGILFFHQGWTDIINCLGLINYNCEIYDTIYLIIRDDSKELIDYYTKSIKNIKLVYLKKINLNNPKDNLVNDVKKLYNINDDINLLYYGGHDRFRNDKYNKAKAKSKFFCESFYVNYDIPYIYRINYFNLTRDNDIENKIYDDFVKKYGNEYILYHKVIKNYDSTKKIIDLSEISITFFDYIKVLENAIEIHLLDSVWGAIVYLLDAKYELFKNKKIFLYAKRGYNQMFTKPLKLNNWKII